MNQIIPDYYKSFKCIADKCKHSCCIGWEIDIDDKTYNKYTNIDNEFGKTLRNNIKCDNGTNCFILGQNDRCPFLNENNLCEIIINCGESHLCEICAEHPRFHNYYDDRIESGIGLCCEEAAKIILANEDKVKLVSNDKTSCHGYYYEYRNKLFKIVQNRDISIIQRVNQLIEQCDFKIEKNGIREWTDIYLSLERLDNKWTEILNNCENNNKSIFENRLINEFEIVAEQLIIYFLYRYTPKAEFEMSSDEWILFSVLSCYMIFCICEKNSIVNIDGICDIARMYSSEIEYSDENIDIIFSNI